MSERIRRLLCRFLGHAGYRETRAEPVTLFWVCRRCGKFWR